MTTKLIQNQYKINFVGIKSRIIEFVVSLFPICSQHKIFITREIERIAYKTTKIADSPSFFFPISNFKESD